MVFEVFRFGFLSFHLEGRMNCVHTNMTSSQKECGTHTAGPAKFFKKSFNSGSAFIKSLLCASH